MNNKIKYVKKNGEILNIDLKDIKEIFTYNHELYFSFSDNDNYDEAHIWRLDTEEEAKKVYHKIMERFENITIDKDHEIKEDVEEKEEEKPEPKDYELYIDFDSANNLSVCYDKDGEKMEVLCLANDKRLIFLAHYYLEWLEKGAKIYKHQEDVEFNYGVYGFGKNYGNENILKRKDIEDGSIFNFNIGSASFNCKDENIIRHPKTKAPILF